MLTQLSARNFKSWAAIDQMRLAPITGFFGTNSSGKSSILQLLLLIKQTIESSDRKAVLDFGDEKSLVSLGGFRDVVFGHVEGSEIEFGVSWDFPEAHVSDHIARRTRVWQFKEVRFRVRIKEDERGFTRVVSFEYDADGHRFAVRQSPSEPGKYRVILEGSEFEQQEREGGLAYDLPISGKFYEFPIDIRADYRALVPGGLSAYLEEAFKAVYYLGPLRDSPNRHYLWGGMKPTDMGRRGERVVDVLLASRRARDGKAMESNQERQSLEGHIVYWLKRLGLIHDFWIEPIGEGTNLYRVQVQSAPGAPKVLLPDVGFGVSQVLPVLALCYYVPEGSTILLEQPEMHLHPSAQMGLADVFIDAVQNRHIQIILESHSEHLLGRLQRRIAEGTFDPNEAALYFCEMGEGGSRLTPLHLDPFGNITNWPEHFFGDEFGEMAAATQAAMKRKQGIA